LVQRFWRLSECGPRGGRSSECFENKARPGSRRGRQSGAWRTRSEI